MGMSLIPKAGESKAQSMCYNWTAWGELADWLAEQGVPTAEFRGVNDGDPISAETCRAVADALEHKASALPPGMKWHAKYASVWRDSGGFFQH